MMTTNTLNKLTKVSKFLISNAKYASKAECASAKQKNLFDLLKYAVRKEQYLLSDATGINVTNICKTTRQFNWLANETEYGLRKLFKNDPCLKNAWDL